ncbi:MAG: hypothetical protein FWH48_03305, partial [Oscillospiraceae bacterium]|nr:hypothetical protein [Oscillospiraceae bacterium]
LPYDFVRMKTVKQLFCSFFCYYYIIQGGGRRSLTEDLKDLDGAKWDKSSVSIDWRELHVNIAMFTFATRADSSFAKGAFGAFCKRKSVAGILFALSIQAIWFT